MTTWTIYDSQRTSVDGFDLAWLPSQADRYLTPHVYTDGRSAQRIELEAGPYVGALPLTTGESLYIAPRVGRQVLARMLAVTERLDAAVRKEFEDFARLGYGGEDNMSWLHLLARRFVKQLRLIETNSLRADRVAVADSRRSVKGRVSIVPTFVSLARREDNPVHCTFHTRAYDTAEHRILGAAAAALLQMKVLAAAEQVTALRWSARFGRPLAAQDLRTLTRSLASGRYTGARSYYIPALVMAQLILVQTGLTFDDTNSIHTEALLTNVYTLFESYVRITLRNALSERGYVVEKLESGAPSLFADGTAELKPDVIISDATGYRLLVDAKYKLNEAIQSPDYYQIAAYLKGYQVREGMIVRPHTTTASDPVVSRRMNYGGTVHELRLGVQDAALAEDALIAGVTQVLAGSRQVAP